MLNPQAWSNVWVMTTTGIDGQPANFRARRLGGRRAWHNLLRLLRKPYSALGVGPGTLCVRKQTVERVPVEISESPIETVDGTLVSLYHSDITERKELEERARQVHHCGRTQFANGFAMSMTQSHRDSRGSFELGSGPPPEQGIGGSPGGSPDRISSARDWARQNLERSRSLVLKFIDLPVVRGDWLERSRVSGIMVHSSTGVRVGFPYENSHGI